MSLQFSIIFIFSFAKFFTRSYFFCCNFSVPLGNNNNSNNKSGDDPRAQAEKTQITFTRFALTFATAARAAAKRRTSAESQSHSQATRRQRRRRRRQRRQQAPQLHPAPQSQTQFTTETERRLNGGASENAFSTLGTKSNSGYDMRTEVVELQLTNNNNCFPTLQCISAIAYSCIYNNNKFVIYRVCSRLLLYLIRIRTARSAFFRLDLIDIMYFSSNFNEIVLEIDVQPHDLYVNIYSGFLIRFSAIKRNKYFGNISLEII